MPNSSLIDPTPTPVSKWQDNRLVRVGIRVLRTYIQSVIGFLAVAGIGTADAISGVIANPPADGPHLILTALYSALYPALVALLWNGLEELNKVDPGTTQRG